MADRYGVRVICRENSGEIFLSLDGAVQLDIDCFAETSLKVLLFL